MVCCGYRGMVSGQLQIDCCPGCCLFLVTLYCSISSMPCEILKYTYIAAVSVRFCAGVQIVFYFLYGNCQVAFAFLLSCFFNNTRTANVTCWIWVLGAGLFAGNLLDSVFAAERWWAVLVELIPTFGAYRYGLFSLTEHLPADHTVSGLPPQVVRIAACTNPNYFTVSFLETSPSLHMMQNTIDK